MTNECSRDSVPAACTRRGFLQSGLVGGVMVSRLVSAATAVPKTWQAPPVCFFSKHLQFLDYTALAERCRDLGADGIDLTVRPKGHVAPERVEEDLPKACEAARQAGIEVAMVTTRLQHARDAEAERILKTGAGLGIKYFRIGGHEYAEGQELLAQLGTIQQDLEGLVKLAEQYDVTLGYHNHSGGRNVGAPLWDLERLFAAIHSPRLGANFDVGHAKVEGAYGAWQLGTELLAPHMKMMSVKDFVWDKDAPCWLPLGQGIVPLVKMLSIARAAGFLGPISIHVEYKVGSDEAMLQEMRNAVPVLRRALTEAGYTA
ncbi:MAG: sugar phosphate isomerase/epimerase [Candidatus Hydrogenedentes bacterium]|nr:sugar phosphate isomerase/epimerase [Candidatus Hydrogenedentota bacterium]